MAKMTKYEKETIILTNEEDEFWNVFTYNRIDEAYKKEFVERMSREFRRALQQNELCKKEFTDYDWQKIQILINGSNNYYELLKSSNIVQKLLPHIPKFIKKFALHILTKQRFR